MLYIEFVPLKVCFTVALVLLNLKATEYLFNVFVNFP